MTPMDEHALGGRAHMTTEPGTDTAAQGRLDALVTSIATAFMPASAASLQETLELALRMMIEFFDVDTSFLRANDLARETSVLIAEWPHRVDVPVPDPIGEVPFDADPVFGASRDLRKPFLLRPEAQDDAYRERIEEASGVGQVSIAMVPLLREGMTSGVLGFVKFGDRPWAVVEMNALQAAASLIVQLQARVAAEEKLQFHAYHDALTGLPNRRALLEELDHRLGPDGAPTSLLFVDLDRFKATNDSLGHGAGDRLLSAMADRMLHAVRPEDFVARLAGDEFVLLLADAPAPHVASVAERLLRSLAEPIEIGGHQITRTVSIGIGSAWPGALRPDQLLGHADVALRTAKADGGNRAVLFDDTLRAVVEERTQTEVLLRQAINEGGLRLHYQPEVDLRTGELLAVEALVRWEHPERGLLSAAAFIDVAEESGLIVELGTWVMAEACRQMAEWRQAHPHRFTMRVNMSPAQLGTRNIVQLVADCLADNGLPGRLLCLEITEHAVMQDVTRAVETLHELKTLGVSLAIDDFGTGYSSMAQLKRLPVDVLKIDQSFVAGLGTDGGDRAIVDATVRLARSFGLQVVAEGIETVDIVEHLLVLGCHRAQGYLLCRPQPPSELETILRHGGIDPSVLVSAPASPAPTGRAAAEAPSDGVLVTSTPV
jgi:diguanylate cyclase (GGDEF)-like protein